jgi:hypothetical protein
MLVCEREADALQSLEIHAAHWLCLRRCESDSFQ